MPDRSGTVPETVAHACTTLPVGINDLLNIIANAGILGECGALCGKLTRPWEADVCNIACDAVGLDEFIKILERSDIDPVRPASTFLCLFMCERRGTDLRWMDGY